MNFSDKVHHLIINYYKENLLNPNELWLGYKEMFELEDFINNESKDGRILINSESKIEFLGLKVRIKDTNSYFAVEYNQYY